MPEVPRWKWDALFLYEVMAEAPMSSMDRLAQMLRHPDTTDAQLGEHVRRMVRKYAAPSEVERLEREQEEELERELARRPRVRRLPWHIPKDWQKGRDD